MNPQQTYRQGQFRVALPLKRKTKPENRPMRKEKKKLRKRPTGKREIKLGKKTDL